MTQILGCTLPLLFGLSLLGLTACGQKGNLYLPTDPSAADRASLPQSMGTSLRAMLPATKASATMAPPPSSP